MRKTAEVWRVDTEAWFTVDRLSRWYGGDYAVTRLVSAQADHVPTQHAAWRQYVVTYKPLGLKVGSVFRSVRQARFLAERLASDRRFRERIPRTLEAYAAWVRSPECKAMQKVGAAYEREAKAYDVGGYQACR